MEYKFGNVTQMMLDNLKKAYPRAVRECDLWTPVMQSEGVKPADRNNRRSGGYIKTLIKNNLAKRITDGYYVYIPQ